MSTVLLLLILAAILGYITKDDVDNAIGNAIGVLLLVSVPGLIVAIPVGLIFTAVCWDKELRQFSATEGQWAVAILMWAIGTVAMLSYSWITSRKEDASVRRGCATRS